MTLFVYLHPSTTSTPPALESPRKLHSSNNNYSTTLPHIPPLHSYNQFPQLLHPIPLFHPTSQLFHSISPYLQPTLPHSTTTLHPSIPPLRPTPLPLYPTPPPFHFTPPPLHPSSCRSGHPTPKINYYQMSLRFLSSHELSIVPAIKR